MFQNNLLLPLTVAALVLSAASKAVLVGYLGFGSPALADRRIEDVKSLKEDMSKAGFELVGSERILMNEEARWFEFKNKECILRIAPLDATGATLVSFQHSLPGSWHLSYVIGANEYEVYPQFWAKIYDIFCRLRASINLDVSADSKIRAIAKSPFCVIS